MICPTGLAMAGAYHQRRRRGGSRLLFALKLGVVAMAVSWIALIASAAAGSPIDVAQMFVLSLLLPIGWLIGRWACDRHPSAGPERALLVGSGVVAQHVLDLAVRHRERRLDVVGRVEADHDQEGATGPPLLGELADLPAILGAHRIDRVIVAFAPAAIVTFWTSCASAWRRASKWTWCPASSTCWDLRRARTRSAAWRSWRFPAAV